MIAVWAEITFFKIIAACASVWHKLLLFLHQLNDDVMKNTEFSYNAIESLCASEDILDNLLGLIEDMDLEITDIRIV